jgi:hypothetical protein
LEKRCKRILTKSSPWPFGRYADAFREGEKRFMLNELINGKRGVTADFAALNAFAAANGLSPIDVPEPLSAAMVATLGMGMLHRLRRQR